MTHEKQNRILNFWFGEDPLKPLKNMDIWFAKNPEIDEQVEELFGPCLDEAETGAFDDWPKTANGAMALVVLCDQIPRMIYRNEDRAFSFDDRALRAAQIAMAHGFQHKYTVIERCFLYLPFEHSESLDMQKRSVELYRDLFEEAQGEERGFIAEALDYAIRHHEIIAQFGRFPHRNEALGRASSRAEREFLKRPDSAF